MKAYLSLFSILLTHQIFIPNFCLAQQNNKLEYTYLQSSASINPSFKGTWQSIGEGYIWEATADSLKLYSYTKNFCVAESQNYLVHLLHSTAQFKLKGTDSISLYYHDLHGDKQQMQEQREFVRVEKLPKNCHSYSELQHAEAPILFELFLETLQENYAFSTERNMNWEAIRNTYASKITNETTLEELFQLMGEIVTLTKDHHTKIIAPDGRRLQHTFTPSAQYVIDSFNLQEQEKNLNQFFNLFFSQQYSNISDSLLQGKGQKAANNKLEWGNLSEDIGYIMVHALTGFTKSNVSRSQQLDSLELEMSKIMNALKDKDAIIIDISFNFGGYDAAGAVIAGFFTNEETYAYTTQTFHRDTFYTGSKHYIKPSQRNTFTKPVYVLMTDISRSAAENFALYMKAIPQAQLVGMNTLGIQSGILNKAIGPFNLTLSNQRFITPEKQFYEVIGVPPDVRLDVFSSKGDIFDAHKNAVREIMKIIKNE